MKFWTGEWKAQSGENACYQQSRCLLSAIGEIIKCAMSNDVPTPINFHDPEDVNTWIEETARKRPWRPEFFNAYVEMLNKRFHHPFSILELGAGPGLLAQQILASCAIRTFVVLDFSAAMLSVARHKLEPFRERTRFVQRDFRSTNWVDGMGDYDAVVSMQAVHEVRHKQHIPALLDEIYKLLVRNGLFLFCDHYSEPDNGSKNPDLYLTREDQGQALLNARFGKVECVLDKGGMALWSATKF